MSIPDEKRIKGKKEGAGGLLFLEVDVDAKAADLVKSVLRLVVAIAKVMALAGRQKGKPKGVIRRVGAAVRRPIKRLWILLLAEVVKRGRRCEEQVPVCDFL